MFEVLLPVCGAYWFVCQLQSRYGTGCNQNIADISQDRCNCLNRESRLVQSHNLLRKNRKVLLSDLSAFVKIAKGLDNFLENTSETLEVVIDLDEMVMKAFKMVTRAVRFLDIWEDLMQSIDHRDVNYAHIPPTPPADHAEFGKADTNFDKPSMIGHNLLANNESARDHEKQTRVRPSYSRSSQTYVRPGSSNSCRQSYNSLAKIGDSISRLVPSNVRPGSPNLASEKLGELHNSFLTCLGYFIGLHIQSRSSSEILLTTKRSVDSCRDMLNLIGQIWERDSKRSAALQEAQDEMWGSIADLALAARDVLKPLRTEEDDSLVPSEGKSLVEAATTCVRAAGECVAESRFVIDRIGDFEFEDSRLGISDIEQATLAAGESVGSQEDNQTSTTLDDFEVPPEPSNEPPPPPLHLPIASEMLASTLSTERRQSSRISIPMPSLSVPSERSTSLQVSIAGSNILLGAESLSSPPSSTILDDHQRSSSDHFRTRSLDTSSAGDGSTYVESMRGSDASSGSTRGTSPDGTVNNSLATTSFSSDGQSTLFESVDEDETRIMETTFAHELIYNKEGQITGGTLPALIERLTTHDSTPDATFVSTFYLTFRLFATPTAIAQALIDRFQYVAESPSVAGPVRLRVYNVFKGWLESHWRNDCDGPALDLIVPFATRQLQIVLPTAGKRLATLATKVTAASGPLVPRLISSIGKTNTSIGVYIAPDTPLPPPIISKSQLNALKNWKHGGGIVSILDFEPLELARQFTIKKSQIFCSILPEELLATEWMKKSGSMAVNVRAMSRLSTDLTNLVADCILQLDDPKKRAVIIKQWVKIASKCLDLANYDSLMAIICALDGSTILRLKRTWELVSAKTKATLDHLKTVVDISRNYTVLRQRLQTHVPPCLPFVGTYLTDLTFVDVGNQTTRQLHGAEESKAVINFDKHMKTAKIISELQRFQIPYRFTEIPELQTWMQDQLVRVRTSDECNMTNHYRRSLLLEPREQLQLKHSPTESQHPSTSKEKFELFGMGWAHHHSKEKLATTPS